MNGVSGDTDGVDTRFETGDHPPLPKAFAIATVPALAFAAFVPIRAYPDRPPEVAIGTVLLIISAVLAWRLVRHPGARTAYGLFVTSAILMFLPTWGTGGVLLALIATAATGMLAGFRPAVLLALLLAVVSVVTSIAIYGTPIEGAFFEGLGLLLLMGTIGAFGATARAAEQARALSARQGAELAVTNAKLRASMANERELVLAQERARSARDLHDGLGHRLTLISMSLEFARRTKDTDPDRAWAEVEVADATNQDALDVMRRWVRALNPPRPLAGHGGAEAFDVIADAFRGTGFDVSVEHRGDTAPLPDEVSLYTTRFVQEGLTNVLRHSDAQTVRIDIVQSPAQVRIAVRDDGDPGASVPEGFGLRSLRERAEELGGSLLFGPVTGSGWETAVVLPLQPAGVAPTAGQP